MTTPAPNPEKHVGIKAVFKCDHLIYEHEITSRYLSENLMSKGVEQPAALSDAYQRLRPFELQDMLRLGFDKLFAQVSPEYLEGTPFELLLGNEEDRQLLDVDISVIDGELQ
ncbi:MAG: hypothetical protein F6J97_18945 [Leptolyngbya sp. SIO4C1]|nr:hypothetical protein [Leptolyngbya sp. SIO4C1]